MVLIEITGYHDAMTTDTDRIIALESRITELERQQKSMGAAITILACATQDKFAPSAKPSAPFLKSTG